LGADYLKKYKIEIELTPVILATQKAEIRGRIAVRSQPRQKVHKTLSQKKKKSTNTKQGWWSGSRYRP
jgi:hypothetical protein